MAGCGANGTHTHESGGGCAPDGRRHVRLAHADAVRARREIRVLARGRTRQLLCRLIAFLVACRLAVAQPGAMASLGNGAVPADGGPSKHGTVGNSRVLRSRALSVLCGSAPPVRAVSAGGSSRSWSVHLGCGVAGLHPAGNRAGRSVFVDEIDARRDVNAATVSGLPHLKVERWRRVKWRKPRSQKRTS